MRRLTQTCLALAALAAALAPAAFSQRVFQPDCELPIRNATAAGRFERQCGEEGAFKSPRSDKPAHRAQNRAKNNFCAAGRGGTARPVPLTFALFDRLQRELVGRGIEFGDAHSFPEDRAVLRDFVRDDEGRRLGEGSYVELVGYVPHADRAAAESVTCGFAASEFIDTHVNVSPRPGDIDLCETVVVELSAHFRPEAWGRFHFAKFVREMKTHPVRFRGHLMLDAGHRACGDPKKKKTDPKRRSLWEIHPVYSIDVCRDTTIAGCRDESAWTPFDEWMKTIS